MAVRALIVSVAILALWAPGAQALPGPSGAGDASVAQYGYSAVETPPAPLTPLVPPAGGVLGEVQRNETGGSSPTVVRETAASAPATQELGSGGSSPSLPFTGMNVLIGVLAGCLLIAGGAAMRRVGRPTPA